MNPFMIVAEYLNIQRRDDSLIVLYKKISILSQLIIDLAHSFEEKSMEKLRQRSKNNDKHREFSNQFKISQKCIFFRDLLNWRVILQLKNW